MDDQVEAEDTVLQETLEENIGMSQYEASVYLALIRGGKQSMTEISESSGVPKQRVYDTVSDLRNEGFVEVIDDYPRKAYAIDPSEALSPIKQQITRTEERLDELHEAVEEVEGGVALFKSEPTIKKYIRKVIESVEDSLFLLLPRKHLNTFRDDLTALPSDVHSRLIVSDLTEDDVDGDDIYLDESLSALADDVHGVTSNEPLMVSADRERAFYWTHGSKRKMTSEMQGFYITNPELGFLFDRFLSDSIWPLARPVNPTGEPDWPTFPKEYIRLKDCLSDLKRVTRERALESFEVEFEGYDTGTGEAVTKRGTVAGYYFTEFDIRATLKVELDPEYDSGTADVVTVGGWKATYEDYQARRLTVWEKSGKDHPATIDDETERHLLRCREEIPEEFGDSRIALGMDAFVDRMREFVEERNGSRDYESMRKFGDLKELLIEFEASDSVPVIEWVPTETIPGGHTVHLGQVFDDFGYDLTVFGTFGEPTHSVFEDVFSTHDVLSAGEPTFADYILFEDGKLILREPNFDQVDWDTVVEEIGIETLAESVDGTTVLGFGSWSNIPSLPSVWDGFRDEIWPLLETPPNSVVISPADIQQMSPDLVKDGLQSLRALDDVVPVTVTTNRTQAKRLLTVLDEEGTDSSLSNTAMTLRNEIGVSKFVVHTLLEAALARESGIVTARAPRPDPEQVTNSDAHFDTGLTLGHAEGLSDGTSLILANTVAGCFMREGVPPTEESIRHLLDRYDTLFETQ